MSDVPDLGNYRNPGMMSQPLPDPDITVITEGDATPSFDPTTGTTLVTLPDGDVEISVGPPEDQPNQPSEHNDNLAELLKENQLSVIAEKILAGIELDIQSRSEWLENMKEGISLLALQLKTPAGAAASGATPAEGVSTIDHPLLLEAVLRFQANARGELLPADGPVKVRNDGEDNDISEVLVPALEKDTNHFLTKVATEYYPDSDRMLLLLGFCGISFKKGFHDPIKRRPVIASIDAKDLIVTNAATNIDGAGRVTHRLMMRPSLLRRMQLVGSYRDIVLSSPGIPPTKNPVDTKIDQIQGIAPPTYAEPADQDRELYECYCEIELPGFEHQMMDDAVGEMRDTGLPLPYKVVIDRESRQILEIRRNWEEDDIFCMPRNRIIAYTFIPGLGFYGIGLLNILGNSTKAVTAAWRLMLDAGMFANFPGFLYVKSLAKQLTNQFRIPPGGGMPIDTVGNDIRASIMPLPYKDPSAVFIQLIDNVVSTAQRVGGTAETQIGEGRQDAPVGTTLALIEQATKLMSAVHKRLHQAQGQEFDMLKSLLMEDPESLWRHNKKSKVLKALVAMAGQQSVADQEQASEDRHRALFLTALDNCELVPAADPNTSSMTERYLKVVAMRQMAQTNENIDMDKIDKRAFTVMGIEDPEDMFKPPQPQGVPGPSPEQVTAQANMQVAQAKIMDAQSRASEAGTKAKIAVTDSSTKAQELQSKEKVASLGVAREMIIHDGDQRQAQNELAQETQQRGLDRQHEMALAQMGHAADADNAIAGHAVNLHRTGVDRQHSMIQKGLDLKHQAQQNGLDRQLSLATAAQPAGVAP